MDLPYCHIGVSVAQRRGEYRISAERIRQLEAKALEQMKGVLVA